MFPKSPTRQMYPNPGQSNLIHHIQFHNYHQWHKKKGFLAKLLKTRSNRAFYANGSTLPTNGRATDDASATTTAATISTAISAAIPATISAATSTISTIHAATS